MQPFTPCRKERKMQPAIHAAQTLRWQPASAPSARQPAPPTLPALQAPHLCSAGPTALRRTRHWSPPEMANPSPNRNLDTSATSPLL